MSSEKREASPEASPLKGPAPKAIPEDTSDVAFEDGIPLSPMAGDQSVQFISGTPANGDAKVEIGDSGATAPTFVGLGKEELMKYANDPTWVRLRWLLFILFWVLWIAMLAGAIVIIILAPRCAEKKTPVDTFYQIKAADLIKDSNIDAQTSYLSDLGVQTIIVSEVLQHDPSDEPEAVTDFEKVDESLNEGLLTKAIQELKKQGTKVLLQIVPNHSGTKHEWFNNTDSNFYVREQFDKVKNSVWMIQDENKAAWTQDTNDNSRAYLQQFSGKIADLDFRNDDVINKFKGIFNTWRDREMDGFVIAKASFLLEDLNNLMNRNATRNQPENPNVLGRLVGISKQGPVLVELEGASDETLKQYIAKGLTPIVKSVDTSTSDKVKQALEDIYANPEAVLSLSKTPDNKARLVNLLAGVGGSHLLVNHDNPGDKDFLKKLVEFQKNNPRGKTASLEIVKSDNVIAALRTEGDQQFLIVANFGADVAKFNPTALNLTEHAMGNVILVTPDSNLKSGDHSHGEVSLAPLSGAVVKLENKGEEN